MPSIKRTGIKSQEVKTGFEAYDGPEPKKRGMYRTRITSFQYTQFKSGATGYVIRGVLEAATGDPKDHAQFDGYPALARIVFGDKEMMIARESNLYAALGVANDPSVVFESGDLEQGVKVTKIGGKNPVGLIVNFDIKMGQYEGESRPEVDGIYKVKEETGLTKGPKRTPKFEESEEDEEDLLEEEAEEAEEEDEAEENDAADDEEYEARATELDGMSIPKLKAEAKKLGLAVGGKKDELVERILEAEFSEEDEEAEEEDDEAEEDDEVEVEDDEEEAEEEDDGRAEREAELADLSRVELKAILKAAEPDFTVLKRHSDDDLRETILNAEFGNETPF